MLFYKDPSAENLNNIVNDFNAQTKARADIKSYRHQREVMLHYLTLVFQKKPELADDIIAKLSNYSSQMQDRLAQSMINNNLTSKLPDKYREVKTNIFNMEEDFLKSYNSQNDAIHDVNITDILWMTYFVTGEDIHIEKILKFVSSFPLEIRKAAYEILNDEQNNRPYKEVRDKFTDKQFNEVLACKAVMKSIVFNRQHYKDINEKVKTLMADDSMNYAKDF